MRKTRPIEPADIGKRLLLVRWPLFSWEYPEEAQLLEISPSGESLKFKWPSDARTWVQAVQWGVLEVLPPDTDMAIVERTERAHDSP